MSELVELNIRAKQYQPVKQEWYDDIDKITIPQEQYNNLLDMWSHSQDMMKFIKEKFKGG